MRRRSHKAKSRRQNDPDWFQPDIENPDLVFNPEPDDPPRRRRDDDDDEEHIPLPPQIKRIIVRKIKEAEDELRDPQAELIDLELRIAKCRYSAAVGRFKVSQRHSIREYCV